MWAAQFYKNERRYDWLSSGGAGTMGLDLSIGAAFGRPDDIHICFVGDGGFQMTFLNWLLRLFISYRLRSWY